MLGKQGIGLRVHRTPKFVFREFLRCQAFGKQVVELFLCAGETRRGALFDGGQTRIDDLLNGLVGAAADDSLDAAFLFGREMDRRGLLLLMLLASE
jgi:hypothetical protein